MMIDKIQPSWSRFFRSAFPTLCANACSLDELRRMEVAATMWLHAVQRALARRQARYGRKRP